MSYHRTCLIATLAAPVLLGGCATYRAAPLSYSYYAVPCDTPGAVRAVPIAPPDAQVGAPAAAPPAALPPTRAAPQTPDGVPQASATECLIAVADRGGGWRGPVSYGGGYPRRYYGSPFYGSLGIGIGIGGHHYGGGHRGGGYFGGGHRGGGHH